VVNLAGVDLPEMEVTGAEAEVVGRPHPPPNRGIPSLIRNLLQVAHLAD
jgi:hypothetical protein